MVHSWHIPRNSHVSAISVSHISRSFGAKKVLSDISFSLEAGESVLLSGPNGAGKTTLLRILSGTAPASSGEGEIGGIDLFFDDSDESLDIRRLVGYVPARLPLYDDMYTGEYLRFLGRLHGLYGGALRRNFAEVLECCGLGEHRATLLGQLSSGTRARVALAGALIHRPSVLLLDDPLSTIDIAQRRRFIDTLRNAAESRAILLATHTPDDAARLFTRVLLLSGGRLVLDVPLDPTHPMPSLGAAVTSWLLNVDH